MPIERVVVGEAKIVIRAVLPQVFEALVNPENLRQWWASAVRVEAELGGRYESNPPEGPQEGTITTIEAPRELSFTWPLEQDASVIETTVSYELSPKGPETQVHVVHTSPRTISGDWFETWRRKLDALKAFLETGAVAVSSS